jgi:hypothetical protein
MKKTVTTLSLVAANVAIAFAQVNGTITIGNTASQGQVNGGALLSFLSLAQTLVARLVPFAISLAVLAFFWYLINFIWLGKDKPEDQPKNMKGMGFSILALFVMVSIWGIVGFLGSTLGVGQGGKTPSPCLPGIAYPAGDPCA